jgi:pimeloyl-ACP methyl ester carboxylesterase
MSIVTLEVSAGNGILAPHYFRNATMIGSSQMLQQSYRQVAPAERSAGARPRRAVSPVARLIGLVLRFAGRIDREWAAGRLVELWFRIWKPRPKAWVHGFWAGADASAELHLATQSIPVYFWGRGPLVVCLHGWGGSGTQFRAMIPRLVAAGYRVAVFDAPAHGYNEGTTSNVLEIAQCLMAIERQFGAVDTLIAHSFGGMATLTAAWQGFNPRRMVLVAPGLDVGELFESFCETLDLDEPVKEAFRRRVGTAMATALREPDAWACLSSGSLLPFASESGFLVYDEHDEEVSVDTFRRYQRGWRGADVLTTRDLGHYRILKDSTVIDGIIRWMQVD